MYLSDTNFNPGPQDDFKKTYVKKGRKSSVQQKVSQISHVKDPASLKPDAPGVRTKKHPIKWTTFEN